MDTNRIFIGIASYRDPELRNTVLSAFYQAERPANISVGIVWQGASEDVQPESWIQTEVADFLQCHDDPEPAKQVTLETLLGEAVDCAQMTALLNDRIRLIRIDSKKARGPVWARSWIRYMLREEDFYLQIDSHMRFDANWDTFLLKEYGKC
eukprot:Platyproteum_vivax@DN7090_c0_g2_i1.p1